MESESSAVGQGSARFSRLLLLIPISIFIGCTALRAVTPIAPGPDYRIKDGHGLLVLDIDSDFWFGGLFISRYREIGGLDRSERFHIVSLPAGEYAWTTLRTSWRYALSRVGTPSRRAFRVRAGKLNYPGMLWLRRHDGNQIQIRYVNRSAIALSAIQAKFPHLLARYPMIYTGFQRDDFLVAYRRAKRARAAGRDADAVEPES